jgi:hypothetical protein
MERIFQSRTIWICARLDAIKITDLLYALKRTAMDEGLYPDRFPLYRLSKSFVRIVNHCVRLVASPSDLRASSPPRDQSVLNKGNLGYVMGSRIPE